MCYVSGPLIILDWLEGPMAKNEDLFPFISIRFNIFGGVFQTSELLLGQGRLLSWTAHMCEGCCAPTISVLTNDHIIINLTSFLLCLRAAVMQQQQPLASKLLDSFPRGNLLRPPRMSCVALSLSLVVQLWMKHKPDLNHTIVSLYLVGPDRQSGLLRRVTSSSSTYTYFHQLKIWGATPSKLKVDMSLLMNYFPHPV